jgi:hypothetical protein
VALASVQPDVTLALARAVWDLSVGSPFVPVWLPSCTLLLHFSRRTRLCTFDEDTVTPVVPSIVELALEIIRRAGAIPHDLASLPQSLADVALTVTNPSIVLYLRDGGSVVSE